MLLGCGNRKRVTPLYFIILSFLYYGNTLAHEPSPPGADPLPDRRRTPHRPGDPGGVAGVVPPDRIVTTTPDGLVLEGAWSPPDGDAVGCVVFCHPHPLDGGTMNAPLMQLVGATLAEAGPWALRFKF